MRYFLRGLAGGAMAAALAGGWAAGCGSKEATEAPGVADGGADATFDACAGDACVDDAAVDAADAAPPTMCGTLVGPTVPAQCTGCGGPGRMCQPNGCYGNYWCDNEANRCQAPPTTCEPVVVPDAGQPGPPPTIDAGGPVTSTIGPDGGTESRLFFAVMGDTRPANIDDTSAYPTAIATKIYQDIAGVTPMPPFMITTGDYMFASTTGGQAGAQMALYLQAQANYTGAVFEAMGNHECTGLTASNCGMGNADGITENYTAFMTQMMAPLGNTTPYYVETIAAPDASWTAKFVFIAGNAWSDAQSAWLMSTLAQPTTYTFVVRHEPADSDTAPGVTPSLAIMAQYPYTLSITGHTHTYERGAAKEVVIGNGGAPLSGGKDYGYALVTQLASGAVQIDMYDYTTNMPDTSFRFAVNPDGSAAP